MIKDLVLTFLFFAKIALLSFGGGYVILPLLQRELVEKKQWLSQNELADFFAIAQFQPGPVAINIAVLIATSKFGTIGGITAAIGIAAPSIVLVLIIAALMQNAFDNEIVNHALAGIKVVVAVLVIYAAWGFIRIGIKSIITFLIFAAALVLFILDILNPVIIILIAAVVSLLTGIIIKSREER